MGGGGYAAGSGDFRGGMQMRASGGGIDYHAMASSHMYGNAGMSGMNGLAMPSQSHHSHALPHGSEVFMHGVRVRADSGLPQTDGSADLLEQSPVSGGAAATFDDIPTFLDQLPFSCPSAAANRRLPRQGDVSICLDWPMKIRCRVTLNYRRFL
jgi:hypothetical protein